MSALKQNDIAVLNYIFDPNITGRYNFNEFIDDCDIPFEKEEELLNSNASKASRLEVAGVKSAEDGNLTGAIELFTQALSLKERASGYNNRAQAYRLIGDEQSAMADIEKSLELSKGEGRIGCQALCQRGILYRKLGNDDKARADFTAAARLGSKFAKTQLVELNPYAAMCNQMLHQMLFQNK